MEPQQLAIKDIHLPESLGWWPPAIGWWVLALSIPLLLVLLVWLYKRMTRKTAKKTAKKLLLQLKQDSTLEDKEKLSQLSILIRRVAISTSTRAETASLTGAAWLEYLDSSVNGTPFTQGQGQYLAEAQYQKTLAADLDIKQLIELTEDWLKAQKENKR